MGSELFFKDSQKPGKETPCVTVQVFLGFLMKRQADQVVGAITRRTEFNTEDTNV